MIKFLYEGREIAKVVLYKPQDGMWRVLRKAGNI